MKKLKQFEIDGEPGYDATSAGAYLGVSRRTILSYIHEYLPEPYVINNGYVFKQSDLDRCRTLLNLDRVNLEVTRGK